MLLSSCHHLRPSGLPMVKLALLSTRSNHNARVFPAVGYLALTPVKVEGGACFPRVRRCCSPSPVVRTRLDEDTKPLLAASIAVAVRCLESRIGRLGAFRSNVLAEYHQTVWSKPPDDEWGEIGDAEFPFKITVPVDTPGFSNANYSDYRVFWRVDAGPSSVLHICAPASPPVSYRAYTHFRSGRSSSPLLRAALRSLPDTCSPPHPISIRPAAADIAPPPAPSPIPCLHPS